MTHRKQYLVGLGIPSYSGYIQFVVVTWKDVRNYIHRIMKALIFQSVGCNGQ